jgi:hypothetical protein
MVGFFEYFGPCGVNGACLFVMHLIGCHQAQSGVVMILIIPGKEASAERLCIGAGRRIKLAKVDGFLMSFDTLPIEATPIIKEDDHELVAQLG